MSGFYARSRSSGAGKWRTIRNPSMSAGALAILLSGGPQLASPSQTSSVSTVLNVDTLALPTFADVAAGPRSPTEGESCCSETDMKAYERARTDTRFEMLKVKLFPDYETNRAAIMERRSAVRWADRITAPLLIMHGGDDTSVNPTHALQLAAALQRNGKPYELVIAAGARHSLEPFEAERDERAIRWFRCYLRAGGP
jgi:pimeloyl-ACP methyl ester carboxylesterase